MNIIQCGDLHLGSPFNSLSSEASARRRNDMWGELENLMIYIRSKEAPFVLITGDIFDGMFVSTSEINKFFSKLEGLIDTTFIITPGNHDYYSLDASNPIWPKVSLPKNVIVFTSEKVEKLEFPRYGVDIYGYAFTSQNMPEPPDFSGITLNRSRVNILMGHASLDMPASPHCPISSKTIADLGFDYVCLGHIHKGYLKAVGEKTKIGYSGCFMGRDFGETGPKGVNVIECNGGKITNTKFRPFAKYTYEILSVDIGGMDSISDVCKKITAELQSAISAQHQDVLLRLILTGDVSPLFDINKEDITQGCLKGFFYSEIVDNTIPLMTKDELECDRSLRGAFYASLKSELESDDEQTRQTANDALRLGLRALSGKAIY